MSFLNKVLQSVGIGGVKVDTILSEHKVRLGESIQGIAHIYGGNAQQTIHQVELELKAEYIKEIDDHKTRCVATLAKSVIERNLIVEANEQIKIPFTFHVPEGTPISMSRRNVWIETGLDVPLAIDPEDRDYVEILPNNTMAVILDAMTQVLGFRLREVECEAGRILGAHYNFTQEFEFVPQQAFRGRLDELEIIFLPITNGFELYMQVDRKVRGISSLLQEAVGLDESYVRLRISNEEALQGRSYVAQLLEQMISCYC